MFWTDLSTLINHDLATKGGSTRNQWGATPTGGYMVGGAVRECVYTPGESDKVEDREYIFRFVVEHHALLDQGAWVGAWVNEETGAAHLDICKNITDEGKAIALARDNNQLAYYDVNNAVSVTIRYH